MNVDLDRWEGAPRPYGGSKRVTDGLPAAFCVHDRALHRWNPRRHCTNCLQHLAQTPEVRTKYPYISCSRAFVNVSPAFDVARFG